MSLTPHRRVLHRGAVGVALALAVTGFAAPGLAASPARASTTAPGSAPVSCLAGASETRAEAASYAGSGERPCNTRPDDGMSVSRGVAEAVQSQMSDRVSARAAQALPNNSVAIPVVAHILLGRKKRAGHMTRAGVNEQIAVLNQAYSGGENPGVASDTPFRFVLKKVTKTRNQKWYRINQPEGRDAVAMKKKLRKGKRYTLNLYFVKFAPGLLGYSTFPWNAHGKGLKLDGTVIDYRSRPGGEFGPNYNQGDTAVHEVGHWLGLLHPFQGGCSEPGDYVDDTPAEADTAFKASEYVDGRDSCPTLPGVDPIHNFMDYPPDPIMYEFTPGQAVRMAGMWLAYRAP